jgi:Kef-type K+ transport system membrane component KefB
MLRVILIVLVGVIMSAANQFAPDVSLGSGAGATALACGFLLLTAYLAGGVCQRIALPALTGYLAAGILVGPQLLGLVTGEMVGNLKVFNGVALSLIALTAGTEMHVKSLKPIMRTILWLQVTAVLGTAALIAVTVMVLRSMLPFLAGMSAGQAVAMSLVLGVVLVAQSPAVVVALRDEMDADGPMVQTTMSGVILADLFLIVVFAGALSGAEAVIGGGVSLSAIARTLGWEVLGSLAAGVVVFGLIHAYFRNLDTSGALFVVAICFMVAEIGVRLHMDPLIIMLTAGVLLRNASSVGDRLHHDIDAASLPVYVAFFAVSGAAINLKALWLLGIPAGILVVVRGIGIVYGTRAAARLSSAPDSVRRYTAFGLLPQAGLAIAFALVIQRSFPGIGEQAATLIFGVVAINQLVAPPLFRLALVRSGEAGQRHHGEPLPSSAAPPDADTPPAEIAPG